MRSAARAHDKKMSGECPSARPSSMIRLQILVYDGDQVQLPICPRVLGKEVRP